MLVCDVVVAMILYVLLKPTDENLSLLASFFRLMHVAVYGITGLTSVVTLHLLKGTAYLAAFQPDQQQALARLFIRLHGDGYDFALVFFGFHCLIVGYLIFKSGYYPRSLGILMVIAALAYLTNSFSGFLAPSFQAKLFPGILLPYVIAEGALTFWLIIKGVDMTKWKERTRAKE